MVIHTPSAFPDASKITPPKLLTRSLNSEYLCSVLLFLIAIVIAFFVPMMTMSFLPYVTPVRRGLRWRRM